MVLKGVLMSSNIKRAFGRLEIPDKRDKKFLLSAPRSASGLPRSKTWYNRGWHGDQGRESSCVGYGWSHWLHSSPIRQFLNPVGIYRLSQFLDSWDGENYKGTSVRAGAKVLSLLGAITEYQWTWDAKVIAHHILSKGPVVIGVKWYEGMNKPNRAGLMSVDGNMMGGHCVCLIGYNSTKEMFKVKNSYGARWGNKGFGLLTLSDLNNLLLDGGEACVGVETKILPKK